MVPDRSHIATEQSNPESAALDQMSVRAAVELLHRQDQRVVDAVGAAREQIVQAVEWVAEAFQHGGRLVYFGAGTSGRLGVLDASECPPTFCSDPALVVGVIAGGDAALRKSLENVEDDAAAGAAKARELRLGPRDVALGIAAGGTTPFVHGALAAARELGARTIFLMCTDPGHVAFKPDLFIAVHVGPEVLTGSTRLKAGTATKMVLNTITTLAMVQIGKTYGNLMVDIDALKNQKLVDRAIRIIGRITGLDRAAAHALLEKAEGKVKRAVVMQRRGVDAAAADRLLDQAKGRLREVVG
jgi:N-acetylmuramic acid 6-phosphate etherase